jgi:CBS domain-containing protein
MCREPHCVTDASDVSGAQHLMRTHQIRRLPVVNESRDLVGFLSINDLALASADGKGSVRHQEVAETLAAICRHRSTDDQPAFKKHVRSAEFRA